MYNASGTTIRNEFSNMEKKIVELIIGEDGLDGLGVDAIALVENPAIEKNFLYFKEEKMGERYQVQANPIVEKYLLFSKDPFQEKLASWKIVEEQASAEVIEILPKGKGALFVKTRIWVSKKDWMVVGMEMVERNGDTTLLRYSNIKRNTGLKDSDFQIELPKDVKITEIK